MTADEARAPALALPEDLLAEAWARRAPRRLLADRGEPRRESVRLRADREEGLVRGPAVCHNRPLMSPVLDSAPSHASCVALSGYGYAYRSAWRFS